MSNRFRKQTLNQLAGYIEVTARVQTTIRGRTRITTQTARSFISAIKFNYRRGVNDAKLQAFYKHLSAIGIDKSQAYDSFTKAKITVTNISILYEYPEDYQVKRISRDGKYFTEVRDGTGKVRSVEAWSSKRIDQLVDDDME